MFVSYLCVRNRHEFISSGGNTSVKVRFSLPFVEQRQWQTFEMNTSEYCWSFLISTVNRWHETLGVTVDTGEGSVPFSAAEALDMQHSSTLPLFEVNGTPVFTISLLWQKIKKSKKNILSTRVITDWLLGWVHLFQLVSCLFPISVKWRPLDHSSGLWKHCCYVSEEIYHPWAYLTSILRLLLILCSDQTETKSTSECREQYSTCEWIQCGFNLHLALISCHDNP